MTSANSYHLDEALAMPGVCVYIYIYIYIKSNQDKFFKNKKTIQFNFQPTKYKRMKLDKKPNPSQPKLV